MVIIKITAGIIIITNSIPPNRKLDKLNENKIDSTIDILITSVNNVIYISVVSIISSM